MTVFWLSLMTVYVLHSLMKVYVRHSVIAVQVMQSLMKIISSACSDDSLSEAVFDDSGNLAFFMTVWVRQSSMILFEESLLWYVSWWISWAVFVDSIGSVWQLFLIWQLSVGQLVGQSLMIVYAKESLWVFDVTPDPFSQRNSLQSLLMSVALSEEHPKALRKTKKIHKTCNKLMMYLIFLRS